ncbi:Dynactin subunit 5 [Balamuthia mandrillaris]
MSLEFDVLEPTPVFYKKSEFIETLTGNKVSRKSGLCGSQNIRLHGKTIVMPDAIIRGDLSGVNVGKFSIIGPHSVIRPSFKRFKGGISFFPLTIGDYVTIEESCIINAATIGSYVHIGKDAIISRRCVLKDCCYIKEGSVLAPDTVVPPFTVYGGNPARFIEKLPECFQQMQQEIATANYNCFIPVTED